jgi:hypothetical protein
MAANPFLSGHRNDRVGGDKPKPWAIKSCHDLISSFRDTENATDDVLCPEDTGNAPPDGMLCPQFPVFQRKWKRERSSPTYRDDRLHAHDKIQVYIIHTHFYVSDVSSLS